MFIPVHSEHRMQRHHQDLALQCGVDKKHILILDNGDVAAISKNQYDDLQAQCHLVRFTSMGLVLEILDHK